MAWLMVTAWPGKKSTQKKNKDQKSKADSRCSRQLSQRKKFTIDHVLNLAVASGEDRLLLGPL
jgi:hypothetical protein